MKTKSSLPSILFTVLSIIFILSTRAYGTTEDETIRQITAASKMVNTKIELGKEPLGIKFKVEEYGSVSLEITNNGTEDLTVGSDMLIWAQGGNRNNTAMVVSQGTPIRDDDLNEYVYACGANNFAMVKGDSVTWAFGPGGDWLHLGGMGKSYTGTWPEKIHAQSKAVITQRLALWPGSDKGWMATPVLITASSLEFRILSEFQGKKERQAIIVPMTVKSLEQIINNTGLPQKIREWVVCWLASLQGSEGWKSAAALLTNKNTDIEIRKALARSLSTQSPVEALSFVNEVLWDATVPADLHLICYYALTWSNHQEAKDLIKKAVGHPDREVREDARRRISTK